MCGITGWISTLPERFEGAEATLAQMQRAIAHRGPDGQGGHVDPPGPQRRAGVALGFTRLAIRDLAHGAQPMHGGRPGERVERVVSTLNGELYDERRLRAALERAGCPVRTRCDAELLAHGAALWGPRVWDQLEGMYAAAVWRPHAQTVTLARDPAGQKPLYVAVVDGGATVLWGSELSALLAHPALTPRLDVRGVRALLWLDYIPAPGTALRGVYKLPPGARWTLHAGPRGPVTVRTQAAPLPQRGPQLRPYEAVSALDAALDRAVSRRLVSDVPLGVFLSGGVDSSLVAAKAAAQQPHVQTLAVRFDQPSFDESRFAADVARHLGTQHHEVPFSLADATRARDALLDSPDEPLADPSQLVTWHLCQQARPRVTVALGGDGGDEAWLGYPTFAAVEAAAVFATLPSALRARIFGLSARWGASATNLSAGERAQRFVAGAGAAPAHRHLTWIGGLPLAAVTALGAGVGPPGRPATSAESGRDRATEAWDRAVGWGAPEGVIVRRWHTLAARGLRGLDRERALLAQTYLADGVLQKVDRASMAHGLEVRAPWLDSDVLALAYSVAPARLRWHPGRLGVRPQLGKSVPRALAARLLPDHVATRAKKGFGVPMAAWLRGPWQAALRRELRHADAVPGLRLPQITGLIDAHAAGRANHRKPLWTLWRLVRWWRRVSGDAAR